MNNVVQKRCRKCGQVFETRPHPEWGTVPETCPHCRNSNFLSRELVNSWKGVRIVSLPPPGEWKEVVAKPGATSRYKIDVSGRMFGASWGGRLVIWADKPYGPDDVVDVFEYRSEWRVWKRYETFGSHTRFVKCGRDDDWAVETKEIHRYLVFYQSAIVTPCFRCGWLSAVRKWNRGDWVEIQDATASWVIRGASRSGRHSGEGAFAILPGCGVFRAHRIQDHSALSQQDLWEVSRGSPWAEVVFARKANKEVEIWEEEI